MLFRQFSRCADLVNACREGYYDISLLFFHSYFFWLLIIHLLPSLMVFKPEYSELVLQP